MVMKWYLMCYILQLIFRLRLSTQSLTTQSMESTPFGRWPVAGTVVFSVDRVGRARYGAKLGHDMCWGVSLWQHVGGNLHGEFLTSFRWVYWSKVHPWLPLLRPSSLSTTGYLVSTTVLGCPRRRERLLVRYNYSYPKHWFLWWKSG